MTMVRTVPIDYRTTPAAAGSSASFTNPGRLLISLSAIAIALVLIGDKVPAFAWLTLVLALLYVLLTNAPAAGATINYLTNPSS